MSEYYIIIEHKLCAEVFLDFLMEFQNLSYVVFVVLYKNTFKFINSTLLKEHNYDNDGKYKLKIEKK